jgi:hypothetical protein
MVLCKSRLEQGPRGTATNVTARMFQLMALLLIEAGVLLILADELTHKSVPLQEARILPKGLIHENQSARQDGRLIVPHDRDGAGGAN